MFVSRCSSQHICTAPPPGFWEIFPTLIPWQVCMFLVSFSSGVMIRRSAGLALLIGTGLTCTSSILIGYANEYKVSVNTVNAIVAPRIWFKYFSTIALDTGNVRPIQRWRGRCGVRPSIFAKSAHAGMNTVSYISIERPIIARL